MIETLILGTLAVAAAAVIGYFYGKNKASYTSFEKNGWKITSFESSTNSNDIYFYAEKGEKVFNVTLHSDKDQVEWLVKDVIDE